ncbi:hypothetical protein V6N13_043323 [Hibiscus sabdariffa]
MGEPKNPNFDLKCSTCRKLVQQQLVAVHPMVPPPSMRKLQQIGYKSFSRTLELLDASSSSIKSATSDLKTRSSVNRRKTPILDFNRSNLQPLDFSVT